MESDDLLDEELVNPQLPIRPLNFAHLSLVVLAPVIIGCLIGLGSGIINGKIFWEYYTVVRIKHAGQEGLLFGLVFGLLFAVLLYLNPVHRMSNARLIKVYLRCAVIVIGCWVLAGAIGALLYDQIEDIDPLNKFYVHRTRWALGWARTSFWGARLGGLMALFWAIVASSLQKPGNRRG